jgi:hypothetical protein
MGIVRRALGSDDCVLLQFAELGIPWVVLTFCQTENNNFKSRNTMSRLVAPAAIVLFFVTTSSSFLQEVNIKQAAEAITVEKLLSHIKILSSDEFEGRSPASKGETLTVNYLVNKFKQLGLKAGNPDGTYIQRVPLVGLTPKEPKAYFTVGHKTIAADNHKDILIWSSRTEQETISVHNSDVVFVGYGVVAPEYGWDDYKNMDLKNKTLVMLQDEPQIPDPYDSTKLDPKMFKGVAATYYCRWTYKVETAAQKGAAAVVFIYEGINGMPFETVSKSWDTEYCEIKSNDTKKTRPALQSLISIREVQELFADCGKDYDSQKTAALSKDFHPILLGAKANFIVKNTIREVRSSNVIARLEGSDPELGNEYIVYTAHWDHLGRDPTLPGDQIYSGACDNASGVGAMLEIADAFTKLNTPPKRSLLFLAVTSEEQGLLGSKFYGSSPLYPLKKTVAAINIDEPNLWGRTKDIVVVGSGMTTLEDVLIELAKGQGRVVAPDPEPEKAFYYRSDQFEFAEQGVPAIYTMAGTDFIGKTGGSGLQKRNEFTKNDYHNVTDEVKPAWDLSGAVEDAKLLFELGYRIAQDKEWPEWKSGTEFKAKREEMLSK